MIELLNRNRDLSIMALANSIHHSSQPSELILTLGPVITKSQTMPIKITSEMWFVWLFFLLLLLCAISQFERFKHMEFWHRSFAALSSSSAFSNESNCDKIKWHLTTPHNILLNNKTCRQNKQTLVDLYLSGNLGKNVATFAKLDTF